MNAGLSARQRTVPPIDRWSARGHGQESGGGYDMTSPRTLAPGLDSELARYPGTVFDSEVLRDRGPFYEVPRYTPPADNWVNWTKAGPTRPELHMRCVTLRDMVGNSASRFPYVAGSPTGGMHTMGTAGVARTVDRYVTTPQMVGARTDRLAPAVYASQTYSQTTRVQGR